MKYCVLHWMIVAAMVAVTCSGCSGRRGAEARLATAPSRVGTAGASSLSGGEARTPGGLDASESAPLRSVASADYRLAPRDQVVFEMFNEPDVKTTQRLSSRGEMTLPLAGTVNLAGLTLREAEQAIRKLYEEGGYYVDPHVILTVAEYGSRYVTVLGQVNRPDRIEMPIETASMGLVEAITQAGGFTRLARTDSVQITRRTDGGGEEHVTIDVRGFLGRQGTSDFQLEPGDVVFVPERIF